MALANVKKVKWLKDYWIYIEFQDNNLSGFIDLQPLLSFKGSHEILKNPKEFAKVKLDRRNSTICWPTTDIAPDTLYEWLIKYGKRDKIAS